MTSQLKKAIQKIIKAKRRRVSKMCQNILGDWHEYKGQLMQRTPWVVDAGYGEEYKVSPQ